MRNTIILFPFQDRIQSCCTMVLFYVYLSMKGLKWFLEEKGFMRIYIERNDKHKGPRLILLYMWSVGVSYFQMKMESECLWERYTLSTLAPDYTTSCCSLCFTICTCLLYQDLALPHSKVIWDAPRGFFICTDDVQIIDWLWAVFFRGLPKYHIKAWEHLICLSFLRRKFN